MCTGRRWGEPLHTPTRLLAPVSPCCCQTPTHAGTTQVQWLRLASRWQSPVGTCTVLAWQVEQSKHLFITCTSAKARQCSFHLLAMISVFPVQQLEVLHRLMDLQIWGASSSSLEIPENCYDKTCFPVIQTEGNRKISGISYTWFTYLPCFPSPFLS